MRANLPDLPGSRSMGGLFAVTHALMLPVVEVGGGAGIVTGSYGAYGRNNSPRHTIEGIVVTGLFGAGFTPDYGSLEEAVGADRGTRRRMADGRDSYRFRDEVGLESISRHDLRRGRTPPVAGVQRRRRSDPARRARPAAVFGPARPISCGAMATSMPTSAASSGEIGSGGTRRCGVRRSQPAW